MVDRPLVFVDVETTGGTAWSSRILEIGALRVERGKVVAEVRQVLDPEEPVPGWITNLTGIAPGDTAGMPVFAAVHAELEKLFQDALFVAHNASFDYSFFREEYRRLGHKFAMDKLCTVQLSRALYPQHRSHRLDAVIERGGYQVTNRHRAYDDAAVLHAFYQDELGRLGPDEFYTIATKLVRKPRA